MEYQTLIPFRISSKQKEELAIDFWKKNKTLKKDKPNLLQQTVTSTFRLSDAGLEVGRLKSLEG